MNDLVFLDTETTGLDPDRHEVWEAAYAINDGEVNTLHLSHTLRCADDDALRVNRYWDRRDGLVVDPTADVTLRAILQDATIVGCNPAFDAGMLRARWGSAPWHHRMIAVESFAMPVLRLDRPVGLTKLVDMLRGRGFDVPVPDHTAAQDVHALRGVYSGLVELSQGRGAVSCV